MKRSMVSQYVVIGLAIMGIFMATGCATTDTVSSRFPQLEEKINAAKAAEAEVYAPTPLKSAESKLAQARSAAVAGDMVTAHKLVDEAMTDADYARALAPTEKAKEKAMMMRDEIQALRDEIEKISAVK
ncbi:MAG: DUF4398 domain-containing protein [Syntrophaceae bacterium]|nr:DUF4398 domain-containing protein [Syntrophaceae bacterium]